MRNLIIVGFHGRHRASEVLGQLQSMAQDWVVGLDDAVAAYRTNHGRLRIDRSVDLTAREEGWAGGVVGGAAWSADAERWKAHYGVTEDIVKRVGGALQPGDSAVFALIASGDPQSIVDRLREYGGTVLMASHPATTAVPAEDIISDADRTRSGARA